MFGACAKARSILRPNERYYPDGSDVGMFPSIERGSYDRLECTATHPVYPLLGGKVVSDVASADVRKLLNHWMNEGYAYTMVKKVYNLLTDYFRYLTQQELIQKNPMTAAPMIKKANFLAAQGKENQPTSEAVTTFTPEEIERFKAESYRTWGNGERVYQQAAVDAILDLRNERYFGEDAPLIPDEHGDYTRPINFRRRYYRILVAAGIKQKGLHSIRHTFATTLVNGVKQPDGTIRSLTPRQVADLLGHSTSEITEMYYVKKDAARLGGITDDFKL